MESSIDIKKLTDEELVSEIKKTNNSDLFAVLYDRYAVLVYNKCLSFVKSKVEAEDLTHDIFIKLFIKLRSFKGNSKFSTWLYSFTYNFCVNYIQRDKYRNKEKVDDQAVSSNARTEDSVSDDDIFQLKAEKLQEALSIIEPGHKMVLLMKYQDELSIKEIKEVLNIGESAVKMRLKRAKEKVIEIYKTI